MAWGIFRKVNGKLRLPILGRTAPHTELRYANMDYLFWSHIMCTYWTVWLLCLCLSYDIACQFGKLLFERLKALPTQLQPPCIPSVSFFVPKFHLPVHVGKCQGPFSFNWRKHVGRTDGEGIERLWAPLNPVSRMVSMMTQGGRYDTLDDFTNHNNWKKTIKLC
jgi:hypothetical protein